VPNVGEYLSNCTAPHSRRHLPHWEPKHSCYNILFVVSLTYFDSYELCLCSGKVNLLYIVMRPKVLEPMHKCKIAGISVFYIVHWLKNFCNISFVKQLSEDGHKGGWNMYKAYYMCKIRYSYTFIRIHWFRYHT
jgi:hypothetical protein